MLNFDKSLIASDSRMGARLYAHKTLQGGKNKSDQRWAEKHLSLYKSFDDFVMEWVNRRNINKSIHFKPQYKLITTPRNFKPAVDFICFFEKLNNDYEYVRRKLCIGKELTHGNKHPEKEMIIVHIITTEQ